MHAVFTSTAAGMASTPHTSQPGKAAASAGPTDDDPQPTSRTFRRRRGAEDGADDGSSDAEDANVDGTRLPRKGARSGTTVALSPSQLPAATVQKTGK